MKTDAEKLTKLRQERDTLRETVAVLEEIQALQERLRAIPLLPSLPVYPLYPVPQAPYPWWYNPGTFFVGTSTSSTGLPEGGTYYQD